MTVLCPAGKGYRRLRSPRWGSYLPSPDAERRKQPLGYLWEYGWALVLGVLVLLVDYLRRGFHVIQGCNPPDDIFLVALPFKLFGVKYIFDHHDANPELYFSKYEKKDFLYKVQIWLERLTYRFSDVVMATNRSYRELAINRGGLDPEDVFVVRNGPDLETFKPVPPNAALKHGKAYLVGYVGTMSVQEGWIFCWTWRCISRARAARHPFHLRRRRARACRTSEDGAGQGSRRHGQLHGKNPDKDLLEILSTADVCVNPDKPCEMNDISTMIKIMEYMALGKPIVQFDLKEGRFSAGEASLYATIRTGG